MAIVDIIARFNAADLHSRIFFEEFTFARTQFRPAGGSEVELADAVVLLGDTLIIFQIKERAPNAAGQPDAERKWFRSKVLKNATAQVRDTVQFLQSQSMIEVPNERGRIFNLAAQEYQELIKLVLFQAPSELPDDCRLTKHHVSKTAGFIHVVDAEAYARSAQLLRVPEEIVRYFRYREDMIKRYPEQCASCTEADLLGAFVGHEVGRPPFAGASSVLERLVYDEDDWDLAPLLRRLHDHIAVPGVSDDYYGILREFARAPRSLWREAKLRIKLCIEYAAKGEFALPFRFTNPSAQCGFVFVPVMPEMSNDPNWERVRANAVNFVLAHKYDQRLRRCIGVMVAKIGSYFDIQWCLAEFEWQEDLEIAARLKANFPFRAVSEEIRFSFFVHDEAGTPGRPP
ncbi:MAG: hypothetical protein K2X49_03870 [Acetobacteraceae bacterium]|nr:hypothetical protein [Acetobacteraceae bacterium]